MPNKTVLSDAHHELLVKLAEAYGSEKWAKEDPDRVIGSLLERLVADMNKVSATTVNTLERGIYAPKFETEDRHNSKKTERAV